MKSRMTSCYDYKLLEVPEELGRWHIPDSEIEAELEALAKDHSGEEETEGEIRDKDCVRCICVAGQSFCIPVVSFRGQKARKRLFLGRNEERNSNAVLRMYL